MPFQSEKQRRYLWANEPEIARDWSDTYGHRAQGYDGGVMRVPFQDAGPVIEDFLKNDPFYWSGRVKLENVKPFSEDPDIERGQKHIDKESLGYNPYGDPNIYVRNINEPSAAVGSDVTHEGVHDVVSPTFASQSERGNIVQDLLTDYNSTLPPDERNKISPKEMNEIATNYISNVIHGDVESVDEETLENPALMQALQKNINPEMGQGLIKNWASRAHQNIEAMSPERIDQMRGKFPLDVAPGDWRSDANRQKIHDAGMDVIGQGFRPNQGLKFRDAQNYQQWREANPDAFSGIAQNLRRGVGKTRDRLGNIYQGAKRQGRRGLNILGGLYQLAKGSFNPLSLLFNAGSTFSNLRGDQSQAYYGEPQRQQRRNAARVQDMLARKERGDPYSQANLNQLTMGSRPGHYDVPAPVAPPSHQDGDRHGGGQTQGQRDTARAQRDDPGLGGHKKGGRVRFLEGGLASLWK